MNAKKEKKNKAKVNNESKVTKKVIVNNKKFISNKRSVKEIERPQSDGSSNLLTEADSSMKLNEFHCRSHKAGWGEKPECVINFPRARTSTE